MNNEWIGKHWLTGKTVKVKTNGGKVASLEETDQRTERWIAPGLIDIQLNGIGGLDINGMDTTPETIKQIVNVLHKDGVTRFCPTIVTGTKERILHCIRTVVQACKSDPLVNHSVIGLHIEGPFISPEDGPRGAHNKNWVRDPDWSEFLEWYEAAEGKIAKVTLAPERPGAVEMIKKLTQKGIVAAIGHCNAPEPIIGEAIEAGATMSTHLGNGAHPYIKRHPNYIWAQLADDRLWAGLIADGFHLPYSTLKVMIRTKGKKAILTSDAVNLAGMPPGRYTTHINSDVILEPNGFLHLASTPDILAGSATPLHICVQNVVKFGLCTTGEAIEMATRHPAELFGLFADGVGTIKTGSPADFFLFTHNDDMTWSIEETVSNGETVYAAK